MSRKTVFSVFSHNPFHINHIKSTTFWECTRLEPKIVGDGVGLMAEASPLEDHLPLGYGNGSSHPGVPH
jgi:hypothetical protein